MEKQIKSTKPNIIANPELTFQVAISGVLEKYQCQHLCTEYDSDVTIKNSWVQYLEFNGGKLVINERSFINTLDIIRTSDYIKDCYKDIVIGKCRIDQLLANGHTSIRIDRGADIDYIRVSESYHCRTDFCISDGAHINVITIEPNGCICAFGGEIKTVFASGVMKISNNAEVDKIYLIHKDAYVYIPKYEDKLLTMPSIDKIEGEKGKIYINGNVFISSIDISSRVAVRINKTAKVTIDHLKINGKVIKGIKKFIKDHQVSDGDHWLNLI